MVINYLALYRKYRPSTFDDVLGQEENIKIFNEGCKILAERLEIYITTNNEAKVPMYPPAFGVLTHVKK